MSLGRTLSQVGTIARSIEAFGWDAPLVLEKDKGIVKGHGRYVAAKKLGKKWNNRTSTPVLAPPFFVLCIAVLERARNPVYISEASQPHPLSYFSPWGVGKIFV